MRTRLRSHAAWCFPQHALSSHLGAAWASFCMDDPLQSIPSSTLPLRARYVWLAGFYVFFHVWMNLLAEILRFGDRLFYKAWWNAVTFEAYWRLWNLPVHHWITRRVAIFSRSNERSPPPPIPPPSNSALSRHRPAPLPSFPGMYTSLRCEKSCREASLAFWHSPSRPSSMSSLSRCP